MATITIDPIRFEHCMHCGKVVTTKSKADDVSLYHEWHFHFYTNDSYDMLGQGIICIVCAMGGVPNTQQLTAMSDFTETYLAERYDASDKPVNKNLSLEALRRLAPDRFEEVERYLSSFSRRVVEVKNMPSKPAVNPNDA